MATPRKPTEDDKKVGAELRALRAAARWKQSDAAELSGISTQQYGKYERGENRIPVSRYNMLRDAFAERTLSKSGFSEAGTPYQTQTSDITRLKQDWDQFKDQMDRLLDRLSQLQA